MALVKCQDCGNDVSNRATACPKCGGPISGAAPLTEQSTVTTQQTSKPYKVLLMLGVVMICVGMVSCLASNGTPSTATGLMFAAGLLLCIAGKSGAWWHHG